MELVNFNNENNMTASASAADTLSTFLAKSAATIHPNEDDEQQAFYDGSPDSASALMNSDLEHMDVPESSHGEPIRTSEPKIVGKKKREIRYIQNKASRQDAFYKRKTGIMKKAHELAQLTGNEVLLLVTSETGHVYTYATKKFQPLFSPNNKNEMFRDCLQSIGISRGQLSDSYVYSNDPHGHFPPSKAHKPYAVASRRIARAQAAAVAANAKVAAEHDEVTLNSNHASPLLPNLNMLPSPHQHLHHHSRTDSGQSSYSMPSLPLSGVTSPYSTQYVSATGSVPVRTSFSSGEFASSTATGSSSAIAALVSPTSFDMVNTSDPPVSGFSMQQRLFSGTYVTTQNESSCSFNNNNNKTNNNVAAGNGVPWAGPFSASPSTIPSVDTAGMPPYNPNSALVSAVDQQSSEGADIYSSAYWQAQ